MSSLEDKYKARAFFSKEISSTDRKTLEFIIKNLDELKKDSRFQRGEQVLSEHVIMHDVIELKDITENPELAATYLRGIHEVIENYYVNINLYIRLGKCFEEINMEPNDDIKEAIGYVIQKRRSTRYSTDISMCWQSIKRGAAGKQRNIK